MKKKILIDLERFRYPHSGIASVFRSLMQGFEELNQNFEIDAFGPRGRIYKNEGLRHVVSWKIWHKAFETFSNSYDLIHVSHQMSYYFQKKYTGSKKVVTLHDLNFLHENLNERKISRYLLTLNQTLRYADHVVCISNFVYNDFLKNRYLFDLQKFKTATVIHNGLIYPEKKSYSLHFIPQLSGKKYLLHVGVLFPKKNQLSLIRMLPHLKQDLVLVAAEGKSNYENKVWNEIKHLRLESRVHLLKNISNEDKFALMANCEALCQPSLAEGFGLPPLEAMYFGKPVFLSRFTSLPEIGGDSAFYFDNFDPEHMAETISSGLESYKNDAVIQSKAIARASQFDYKIAAQKYLDFYASVL